MGKVGLVLAIILVSIIIAYGAQLGQVLNTVGLFFGVSDLLNKITNNNIGGVGGSSASAVTAAKNAEPTPNDGQTVCDLKMVIHPVITQPWTAVTVSFATVIDPNNVQWSWLNCNSAGKISTASLLSFLTPTNTLTYSPKLDVGVNGLNTFHYYITLTDQSGHAYSFVARSELVQSVNVNSGTFASDIKPTLTYYIKSIPQVPYTAAITSDLPTVQGSTAGAISVSSASVGNPVSVQITTNNNSVVNNSCTLGIFC